MEESGGSTSNAPLKAKYVNLALLISCLQNYQSITHGVKAQNGPKPHL